MCGRITCYLAPDDLSCSCKYKNASDKESEVSWLPEKFHKCEYTPSFNMGPRDTLACIVSGSHFDVEAERVLCPMMWGMIPPWHKGEPKKHNASTHNARLEGLSTSKLYGKPLKEGKRCAIVINGFYEWQTDKSSKKQPYYMYNKGDDVAKRPLLKLAGLFDKWSQWGETIYSCSILTTASNEVLSWLHHRSPVILQTEKHVQDWLNYESISVEKALDELQSMSLSKDVLQWHPVATTVNNVRNKDKSCIEPIELGKEKKSASSGLMSAWLKTGSMKNDKRKSSDADENSESLEPKSKMPKTSS